MEITFTARSDSQDPSMDAQPPGRDGRAVRVLLLEDVETDAELVMAELRRADLVFEARRVETGTEFAAALSQFAPDVILADYSLPQFNALEALAIVRASGSHVPVILVTGTQTEEIAVECMREGADDYILKERLARLPSAVFRALRGRELELENEAAQAALRRSEERYRLITENTHDLVCLLDPTGHVLYVSPSSVELLGYSARELIDGGDLWRRHPNAAPIGMPEALGAALEEPGRATALLCRHRNGTWRGFECVARSIRDQEGSPQNAVVVLRDVTDRERIEAELREAQLQLIQAEKMESVGRLAAGVAHEVKNPLTAIFMGVEYLRQCFGTKVEPEVVTLLQDMEESARKANHVVRGLLDFSTPGKLDLRRETLNNVIQGALSMLKHEFLRARIEWTTQLDPHLPLLQLDRNKMEQVFVNLFLNAAQSMPEGGTLIVRSRIAAESGAPRRTILAEVEDVGIGIQPDQMQKVFDPFFTTKALGKGSGLGLAVARKIVELHGGRITIRNREDRGVIVAVNLPEGALE